MRGWTANKLYNQPSIPTLMKIYFTKDRITLNKELNKLDQFVISFTKILNNLKVEYVIVSGYVAILFGRSRSSEDIDLLIEKLDYGRFLTLWKELHKTFECIITSKSEEAYKDYLQTGHSIRFAKGDWQPNIEIKMPTDPLDDISLNEHITVILNRHTLYISPLELQITYKLYLGSEKDIEDARHLYLIFKEKLDMTLLERFARKLKIQQALNHLK